MPPTVATPPAPRPGAAALPTAPTLTDRLRRQLAGTPGRLRLIAALTIGVSLLFGALGATALNARAGALSSAQSSVEQLVRLQTVRTRLVQADAEAANAFLVAGLEPAARRAAYVESIETASSTIATAAGRSRSDAAALADVNESLARYTGLVEAARANNRQGLAVGATYLQQASALLRTDILPTLTALVDDNQARVQQQYDDSAATGKTFGLLAVAALGALLVAQGWLALRTRRLVNIGLAAATGAVLLVVVVAAGVMLWSQSRANRAHTRAYAATVEIAQARIDAFDAKSAESLTLVARGSGQAYEEEFLRVAADARTQLAAAARITRGALVARDAFRGYEAVHTEIRKADNAGDYSKAVQLATGDGGANAAFAAFDRASATELDKQSAQIVGELRRARRPLRAMSVLVLLGGLLAAVASSRGVAARLQEYR